MNQKRLVCLCNHVSALEIRKILKAGALTVADVQHFTAAGTGCGRCVKEIGMIVEKHTTSSHGPQFRINFEQNN